MTTLLTSVQSTLASRPVSPTWETEAFLLQASDRAELLDYIDALDNYLQTHPKTDPTDLAFTLNRALQPGGTCLGIVARSSDELRTRLARARQKLADPKCEQIRDTSGIYWFAQPLGLEGQVAFLFPGEGAQYPRMLADVVAAFPETRAFLDEADAALAKVYTDEPPISSVFGHANAAESLSFDRLDHAMLSVLLADGVVHRVITRLGIRPAMAAGHSMGEMAALSAAGAVSMDEAFLQRFSATMQHLQQQEAESSEEFVLLAVGTGAATIGEMFDQVGIYVAMDNCPHQTVLIGAASVMEQAQRRIQQRGWVCERLSFRRPYHTPLFEPSLQPLRELFRPEYFKAPKIPVYSCTTTEPFPTHPHRIRELAIQHWAAPVRFTSMITAMHTAGARLFVEIGPRGNLSAFVEDILRGKRFAALPANTARRSGLTQLNHLVAQLAAHQVPMQLSEFYAPRSPQLLDLRLTTRSVSPSITSSPLLSRSAILQQYLSVMEQFLDTQQQVTEAFLNHHRTRSTPHSQPTPIAEPAATVPLATRPLLGKILHHVPGKEVITRRTLDLSEDLFALDHTVGGRMVSKADPDQHGVPVMPMTFTLEILAECAGVLVPDQVVTAIRQIRLLRWLAFEFDQPALIEVSAKLEGIGEDGQLRVRAEVRDLGAASAPNEKGPRVASGVVYFAPMYPPPPPANELPGQEIRPISLTVEQVYHNLFHGPMFQGVTHTLRASDMSIEAGVEVLPRQTLFRSIPDPTFQFDPVLLDVVLHPLATWHLHQPDLAGRIMLPVGVEAAEFYAPPASPGTKLISRSWISEATLRSFSHDGEVLTEQGTVYLRLKGMKCWRFYVPFGEVNFHGPKDQYFLGRRWSELEVTSEIPFALVKLEIPADLKQPAMSRVTAQVTLSARELTEFRTHHREKSEQGHHWLFDRIAAKDAIRLLWFERRQERLYPADIECHPVGENVYTAHRREVPGEAFDSAVVAHAGAVVAALSSTSPVLGLALAAIAEPLDEVKARCAQEAVAGLPNAEQLRVHVVCDEEFVVAYTLGERIGP